MNQQLEAEPVINGFSLLELVIAMTITIVMLGIASTVLSSGFRIRNRENAVSDAIADLQRAINIMSREIANAGFNLTTNGIVEGDSNANCIRVRSNLNRYDTSANSASRSGVIDPGEDVKYFVNTANSTNYLVRYDANASNPTTVLANRLDVLRLHYFASKVNYGTSGCDITPPPGSEVTPSAARYVVIAACVQLPAYGVPNTEGFQPASNLLLVSDVTLRNANVKGY